MSTAKQNIFRAIDEGRRLVIYLTQSEKQELSNISACPVHIQFSDESCYPYAKETEHHKEQEEISVFVNQRQKRAYLLSNPGKSFGYLWDNNRCPYGTTELYAFIG